MRSCDIALTDRACNGVTLKLTHIEHMVRMVCFVDGERRRVSYIGADVMGMSKREQERAATFLKTKVTAEIDPNVGQCFFFFLSRFVLFFFEPTI